MQRLSEAGSANSPSLAYTLFPARTAALSPGCVGTGHICDMPPALSNEPAPCAWPCAGCWGHKNELGTAPALELLLSGVRVDLRDKEAGKDRRVHDEL